MKQGLRITELDFCWRTYFFFQSLAILPKRMMELKFQRKSLREKYNKEKGAGVSLLCLIEPSDWSL